MLLKKVKTTIKDNHLLEHGDKVLCAVSGGADSVCLLHVMQSLKAELNLTVFVANVNHLLRGDEAYRDSNFVKSVCKACDVPLFYREYDVSKIAKERKIGEEECGRLLRYEFFEEISKELGGVKIATAHNLNDNAETVLFRLARGTSAHGLSGIRYKRDNIIRPLLDVSRQEIEAYLIKKGISWCEDSTNKLPLYARNKLRLSVLPKLGEIVPGVEKRIVSAAKLISEDDEYLCSVSEEALKKCLYNDYILLSRFKLCAVPIKRRIASSVLALWGMKDISADRIEEFILFADKETGKKFDINSTYFAEKSYDKICLRKRGEESGGYLSVSGEGVFAIGTSSVSFSVTNVKPEKNSNMRAFFDADKLNFPLIIRYREKGDRIRLKGMSGTKKISDIFTDEKIERTKRASIPLIVKDDEVMYICGLRQSSMCLPDENTKSFLVIDFNTNDNNI